MSRNNTGNPIGSKAFADFEDNVKNLDEAVNAEQDTFQDRLGKSRLTWAGIVKAGTGDPGEIVPIVQQAAQDAASAVMAGVDGQVAVAESAADRAETARDAAFVNADVYPDIATGRAAVANGEQFQVVSGDEIVRYRRDSSSTQTEVARFPAASAVANISEVVETSGAMVIPLVANNVNFNTDTRTFTISGTVRCILRGRVLSLPAGSASWPSANGVYRIVYGLQSGAYSIVLAHASGPSPDDIVLGGLRVSSGRLEAIVGFDDAMVDTQHIGLFRAKAHRGEYFATVTGVINFDRTSAQVSFPAGRVYVSNTHYAFPAQTISSAAEHQTRGRILFNTTTQQARIISGVSGSPGPDEVQIGLYDVAKSFFDIAAQITVDGIPIVSPDRGELLATEPEALDFQLQVMNPSGEVVNQLVVNGERVRLWFGGSSRLLSNQTIQFGNLGSRLVYNYGTGLLRVEPLYDTASHQRGDVIVGYFYLNSLEGVGLRVSVYGIPRYAINGVDASEGRSTLPTVRPVIVNGITDASYEQPPLDGFEWIDTAQYQSIYDLYDGLVAQYPDYVTRSNLGNDSLGNPIYRYDFTPPAFNNGATSRAKIIIASGHHGYEKAGIYVAYRAFKEICDRWQESPQLETLRWGVHFIVIPMVSPWGFDNNTRVNENGVDPERNYPAGWNSGVDNPSSNQYRGPSPLSEPACQYVDQILSENRDAVYYCTFHNMDSSDFFIWNAAATPFSIDLGNRLSARQTLMWAKRFPWATPGQWLGYSDFTAPVGSSTSQSTDAYGIQGSTLEVSRRANMAGDTTLWGPMVATLGVEVFINWMLLNLEYGSTLKNSSIRLPG